MSTTRAVWSRLLIALLLCVPCDARYRVEAEVGPKPGSVEASPLHAAVETGDVHSVAQLLAAGAHDVDALDADHYSPLHLAAGMGYTRIAGLLCEHGASVASVDEK